jgi:hypothetical protein
VYEIRHYRYLWNRALTSSKAVEVPATVRG